MQPGLIGRVIELAAVDRLLDRAADRRAALVVRGEAGIGKTTLWDATLRAATERGYEVLAARPVSSESSMPLSGFGDLLGGIVPLEARRLPGPQRFALEAALLIGERIDQAADQRTLAVATTTLLRGLSEDRPVLIAVDDANWLDDSSARLISYALRRLSDRRIGLVITERVATIPRPLGLDVWETPDRVEELVVGPLSVAALHQMLATRVDRSFSRLAMIRIQAEARGNPFHAMEIARALIRAREPVTPGRPLPIPETLADLMSERIGGFPRATLDALLLAAVAIEPATRSLLERAGIDNPTRALAPAVRDGVVHVEGDELRFIHPLLASAVVSWADPARLRDVHRHLAEAAGSQPARAQHRARAVTGPDEGAADALDAAAGDARLRGAPVAAGELLELARSLTPAHQPDTASDRVYRAAQCYFEGGEAVRADWLLTSLRDAQKAGADRARTLQLLAQVQARSSSMSDALSTALQAHDEAGNAPGQVAGIELDIAFYAFCLGDMAGALAHARAALLHAEADGLDAPWAEALAGVSMAEFWLGHGRSQVRMAEALAREDPLRQGPLEMRPRFVEALLLLWTGDLDASADILSTLRAELVDRGHDTALPFLSLFAVVASLWRGDLALATAHADEAWDTAALNTDPVAKALALSERAMVNARRGDLDRVRVEAAQALELFRESRWNLYLTWPLWALGQAELSLGNVARVDELLRPLCDEVVKLEGADPILGVVLPDEIEALVELGAPDRAARYVAWLEDGGRRLDRPWALALAARCRGILAAAAGDLDGALAALDEALVQHGRLAMPFEAARTSLVKGRTHRRRKEKRLASLALGEAVRVFDELGAEAWARQARRELDRIGLRPRAPTELTATEQRVAELAAGGMTNRQVAKVAFLSPKTVDNVLGRVYRKLGIASRAELGAVMGVRTQSGKT